MDFMDEELAEYAMCGVQDDIEGQLDALVDLVYVALGTAYMHGFDFNEAFKRVHEANMKKVRAVSMRDSKRGSIYDVVKPEDWTPPDLSDLVKE
jgi:predicted HAD superfamily Cof-like phosphohydrolase